MFCTACAIENSESTGFCHDCGEPLSMDFADKQNESGQISASLTRTGLVGIPILALLLIGAVFGWKEYSDQREASLAYARGVAALSLGAYETAQIEFTRAGDYRDASQQRSAVTELIAPWETAYLNALTAIDQERFAEAMTILESLQSSSPGYRDSPQLLELARQNLQTSLLNDAEVATLERDWLAASASYNQYLFFDPGNFEITARLAELQRQHAPLLLVRQDEIYLVGPDLDDEHLVTDAVPAAAAVWSPDRTQIAFLSPLEDGSMTGSLYVVDVDGQHLLQLASDAVMLPFPAWRPDGRSVAYLQSAGGDDTAVKIIVREVDSTQSIPLEVSSTGASSLTWSPGGEQLAYIAESLTISESLGVISRSGDVIVINLASGQSENLTAGAMPGASAVQWSPAGNYLAIWETVSGTGWYEQYQSTIHLYDIGSGALTAITSGTAVVGPPAWSPDGDLLAWVQGGNQVEVQEPQGERVASFSVSVPVADRLVWSPDGLSILASSPEPPGLSAIIPITGDPGEVMLLSLEFDTDWPNMGLEWAPLTQPIRADEPANQPPE